MTTIKTWSSDDLQQYLTAQGYHPTYYKGNDRGFYNPRNRQTMLVPIKASQLSKNEIITLFKSSKATDMPAEIELENFQSTIHSLKTETL